MKTNNVQKKPDFESLSPELFYINRAALRDIEKNLVYGLNTLQQIVDEFSSITGSTPTIKEIKLWFGQNKSDYLVANVDKIKISVFAKRFTEESRLKPLFNSCHKLIYIPEVGLREVMFWEAFQVCNGKVEVIHEFVEAIKNTYRGYAITTEEKERLAQVKRVCASMNELKIMNPSRADIHGIFFYDEEEGSFLPHQDYVKGFLR